MAGATSSSSHGVLLLADCDVVPQAPAWARPRGDVQREVDAGYLAGVAVSSLDSLVRGEPIWASVWRQRLALKSAAAVTRLFGRQEAENALQDGHFFRAPGDDPGPARKILLAWRRLACRSAALDEEAVRPVAGHLDITWDEQLAESCRTRPDTELSAFWPADAVLAKKFRWPVPVPLLMGQVNSSVFKAGETRRRIRPGEEGWGRVVLLA